MTAFLRLSRVVDNHEGDSVIVRELFEHSQVGVVGRIRIVFLQFAERAAGVLKPRLDGAGVFPYLADMGIDIGIRHGQADELDRSVVFFLEIPSPVRRDIAALDDNPTISRRTAERVLQKLQAEGVIEKVGAARATVYRRVGR